MNPTPYGPDRKDDKSELIKSHLPLVEMLVERMVTQVPAFITKDDMTSAAMMGLVDAVNRFDRSKGIMFKTFAEHRMRGAIYDEVRKMDWFSRSLREKHSRLGKTINSLENQLGRSPEEEEVAAALGLDLEEYYHLLTEVSHLGCVSLHETLDSSGSGLSFLDNLADKNGSAPLERYEALELTKELADHLAKLSEKERLVISLYYYEELTQKEIAEVLEVSEGRVSQLHSQALVKLKVKIQNSAQSR